MYTGYKIFVFLNTASGVERNIHPGLQKWEKVPSRGSTMLQGFGPWIWNPRSLYGM